jgi:hypothetical protein
MSLDAMFAQILADPYGIQIRLDYAEALRETDPEHADLIKQQVHYSLLRSVPAAYALTVPINKLLAAHRERIAGDIAGMCKNYIIRRGFVEGVHVLTPHWLEHGQRMRALAPVLDLTVREPLVVVDRFLASSFTGIRSIDLRMAGITDAHVQILASNPTVSDLLWLNLSQNGLGQASLDALAASEHLPRLAWLGFAGNAVGDPTPDVADDTGFVVHVDFRGRELEAKYGEERWLSDYVGLGRPGPYELSP